MSGQVTIRCYDALNDFLPFERRTISFTQTFRHAGSIKDLVESLGVPHTEIDLLLVNGASVDFDYIIRDGDRISVYPCFRSLDLAPERHLQPPPLAVARFVLDTHLGRLAAYLRMLGFDSLYRNDYEDGELARLSVDDERILLTRDRKLLMRKQLTRGYYVRARQPRQQLLEVLARFDLAGKQRPFTRCMHCNGDIQPVPKETIADHLMPRTRAHYHEFWLCLQCRKIYWQGSHYRRMQHLIAQLGSVPPN
jgi:uncharacterized protein with PIN domain/sulfur carrier protein ThiS